MSTQLLDGNVLVALVVADHVHHEAAASWFARGADPFATCPITQGTLLRLLLRGGLGAMDAERTLGGVVSHVRHDFWADSLGYGEVDLAGVIGHRQVTDAYLAGLARAKRGRLATFDRALAAQHRDVTELLDLTPT